MGAPLWGKRRGVKQTSASKQTLPDVTYVYLELARLGLGLCRAERFFKNERNATSAAPPSPRVLILKYAERRQYTKPRESYDLCG